jgi:hypothetical protein
MQIKKTQIPSLPSQNGYHQENKQMLAKMQEGGRKRNTYMLLKGLI